MVKKDPDPAGSVINRPHRSGPVVQDYGSADPDSQVIVTDPPTLLNLPLSCGWIYGDYGRGGPWLFDRFEDQRSHNFCPLFVKLRGRCFKCCRSGSGQIRTFSQRNDEQNSFFCHNTVPNSYCVPVPCTYWISFVYWLGRIRKDLGGIMHCRIRIRNKLFQIRSKARLLTKLRVFWKDCQN